LCLCCQVPSAAPTNITATAVSSTVIHASWSSVLQSEQNGLIRGYKVNVVYTLWLKKYTWLLIITSANVDRFSKFFYGQIPKETVYVAITASNLKCIATLPCKIQKSKITTVLLLIPSKLIGFSWNLTNLNNI